MPLAIAIANYVYRVGGGCICIQYSPIFAALKFRGFCKKIYCHENIIVNIQTSLTFCGNSDRCLLAFHENLNMNTV